MKKLLLATVVLSLNFVSCSTDDLESTNQTTNAKDEPTTQNNTVVENQPIKDKTRDKIKKLC